MHEALRAGRRRVFEIWATAAAIEGEDWLRDPGVPVHAATTADISHRADSEGHQGVCASVEGYHYVGAHELLTQPDPLIVALDEVQDPQNLGAICRTAEGVGATGLVIAERRAAEVTPAGWVSVSDGSTTARVGRSLAWLMPVFTFWASTSSTQIVVDSAPVPVVVGTATRGFSGFSGLRALPTGALT